MTLLAENESVQAFSIRAAIGTPLAILIALINRIVITSALHHTPVAQIVGFGVAGLIAGAIQGLFVRRDIGSMLAWIGMSGLGWIVIGLPELWFPDNTFSLWLCDYLARRGLVGLLNGSIVGVLQALLARLLEQVDRDATGPSSTPVAMPDDDVVS